MATSKEAWVTVLTGPSYLPGVILLHHSLQKVASRYPLIVAITPTIPEDVIRTLEKCCIQHKVIEPLRPCVKVNIVANRFEDTWSKLRVFEMVEFEASAKI